MALTNYPFGISSFGIPIVGSGVPPSFKGTYYFVDADNGDDTWDGLSPTTALKTVLAAYNKTVSNRDDVILLSTNGVHSLTAMLAVAKNRVHFVGMDFSGRKFGLAARIQFAGTTGATNIAVLKNTGVRNSFHNIKFMNDSTVTQALYTLAEGGEYATYTNCEFYKSTQLDTTGAAEICLNGDSAQFINCTVGSLADAIAGTTILRPCVLLTKGTVGTGLVTRDSVFENCLFWRQCKDTTNVFVYSANATDVERMLLFRNCGFINNLAAANKPAVCIGLAATLTVGNIVLDPTCYASNVTKIATGTGVIVTGAAPNSGTGIGVNAA